MPLDFPSSPTNGQVYDQWQWDGSKWIAIVGTLPAGPAGPTGPAGPGVAAGGTTGQALTKINVTDFNTQWTGPYLTGNQSITLSGDISGSGTTAITTTLATVNANVGTFAVATVNAKGLVTAAANMTGDVTTVNGVATLATVPVSKGGTGATTAPNALTNLGAVAKAGDTMSGALTVNANISSSQFIFGQLLTSVTGAATESVGFGFSSNNPKIVCWGPSSAGAGQITFYTTAGGNSLDASGNLTILGGTATKPGGGSWVAPSDPALKSDIASYNSGLAEVLQLEPIQYSYTGKAGLPTDGVFYGLDAEATRPVMPELVGEGVWAPTDPDTAEEAAEPVTFSTIDSGPLIFALVNAVQELAAQLAELKAKVA